MIWRIISSWLLQNSLLILTWLAAAGAVVGVLFGTRQAGRTAERLSHLKKTMEIKDAQLRAAATSPRTRSELSQRLRDGNF